MKMNIKIFIGILKLKIRHEFSKRLCKVQVSSFISFILPISCTLTNVRRFNNQ